MTAVRFPAIARDSTTGLPVHHWSGRVQAAKALKAYIDATKQGYISYDEATDVAEDILRAYLEQQR